MALTELARYHVEYLDADGKPAILDDTRIQVRDEDGDIHHLVLHGKKSPTTAQVNAFKAEQEPIIMARKAAAGQVAEPVGGKVEP